MGRKNVKKDVKVFQLSWWVLYLSVALRKHLLLNFKPFSLDESVLRLSVGAKIQAEILYVLSEM